MKALVLILAAALIGAAPLQPQNSLLQGSWRNPKATVVLRIGPCGPSLCGVVVEASPHAVADAREAGYPSLVGMQLLRDFHSDGTRKWQGTIFVPDMGRSFASHIELIDSYRARVSGCLIGKFLCKSQVWRRA